jgi:hypothetical protein
MLSIRDTQNTEPIIIKDRRHTFTNFSILPIIEKTQRGVTNKPTRNTFVIPNNQSTTVKYNPPRRLTLVRKPGNGTFDKTATPDSKVKSSNFILSKKIALLEKQIETITGQCMEPSKQMGKRVSLGDLIMPDCKVIRTNEKAGTQNTDQLTTLASEKGDDYVSLKKVVSTKLKLCPSKTKVKEKFNKTEYKPFSSLFFEKKRIKDIKKLVKTQYDMYAINCDELKGYLSDRIVSMEAITYD